MDDSAQSDKTGTMRIGATSDSALEFTKKKRDEEKKREKREDEHCCKKKSEGNTASLITWGSLISAAVIGTRSSSEHDTNSCSLECTTIIIECLVFLYMGQKKKPGEMDAQSTSL